MLWNEAGKSTVEFRIMARPAIPMRQSIKQETCQIDYESGVELCNMKIVKNYGHQCSKNQCPADANTKLTYSKILNYFGLFSKTTQKPHLRERCNLSNFCQLTSECAPDRFSDRLYSRATSAAAHASKSNWESDPFAARYQHGRRAKWWLGAGPMRGGPAGRLFRGPRLQEHLSVCY